MENREKMKKFLDNMTSSPKVVREMRCPLADVDALMKSCVQEMHLFDLPGIDCAGRFCI